MTHNIQIKFIFKSRLVLFPFLLCTILCHFVLFLLSVVTKIIIKISQPSHTFVLFIYIKTKQNKKKKISFVFCRTGGCNVGIISCSLILLIFITLLKQIIKNNTISNTFVPTSKQYCINFGNQNSSNTFMQTYVSMYIFHISVSICYIKFYQILSDIVFKQYG